MSVTIGAQLGSHELIGLLGKGGMGEVYRARDTKLKREVAIKILPDEFSGDPDRVRRFEREAEVLASLNHPNIAAIYDLQEANGSRFLVLELVEGETLAERIKRGPIPVDESLNIAKNICEALEAAHEKGVVHRDLKPANVKITPDGKVKVLDFGLAKAFETEASKANVSQSPTLSMAATNAGVILGTAAYMSPEQAKGRPVDYRTDIFAFGAVLYEMLTSKPVFDGDSMSEILARVIEREPDWTRLPKDAPAAIRRLLRRCLQKDRHRRLQTAIDALIEIEEAKIEPESAIPAIQATAPSRNLERVFSIVAIALATAAAAVLAFVHFRESRPEPPEMRLEISTPATQQPLHFALSPDGSSLAFVATGDGPQRIWIRALDSVAAHPLSGTEGGEYPFWSPDGRSIGFFASSKLKRIDVAGGPPQTLADAPVQRGGTWSRDGIILFAPAGGGTLFRVPAAGGPLTPLKGPGGQTDSGYPQFLPDGRHFLFFVRGSSERQGIYLGSLDADDLKRLASADTQGFYLPKGFLLLVRDGTLLASQLDIGRGELTGDPIPLAQSVELDPGFNLGGFSVSTSGQIAYRSAGSERRKLIWVDRSGKELSAVGDPDPTFLTPALSPDARRIAVQRTVQLNPVNPDIWLMDVIRGGSTRFTFDPAIDGSPIWSPDGNRIAFQSNRKGTFDLYMKASNGTGNEEVLLESPHIKTPLDWSPDGRFIVYFDVAPKSQRDIWVLPMTGDRKPFVLVNTPYEENGAQISPDGRWMAYHSNESGRFEVYVRPFPQSGGKWQVSTAGGRFPRWRADGKELFFIALAGKMMAVSAQESALTFQPGSPAPLFQTRLVSGGVAEVLPQYAVARDGRFLLNTVTDTAAAPITLILNWKPPAK